ncbi:MAG: methyltransferase [Kofleriaceae bacterium]
MTASDPPHRADAGPADRLTRDRLTRDVWLWQRAKGHRFSSDDLVTALVAHQAAPTPTRILDLGCGIGSVLLHLAWACPAATLVGVEAQAVSFALLRRNVDDNQLAHRVTIHHGDLRAPEVVAALGTGFPLVTGTPPYFPPGTALDAADPQRAYARVEHRGGVEAYLATAGQVVAADGVVVVCGDARAEARVVAGAAAAGLQVHARTDVIPRAGEPALFAVWSARLAPRAGAIVATSMTLRDAAGQPTADAARLRAFAGL